MATVTDTHFQTTLPENVAQTLMAAFAMVRNGLENSTNEEQAAILTYAEECQNNAEKLMLAMMLQSEELLAEAGGEAASNVGGVLNRRLLPDVQDGKVVFIPFAQFLVEHPEVLAAITDGEDCDHCEHTECPAHPEQLALYQALPCPDEDEGCEDVELPSGMEEALARALGQ